ncbi:glutamate-5-semialdehyde dehydrogenase [Ruminococcaceae bacterium YRB3002]|nr:glutamate-5-semialdehyde dehydrogenase [Ruminococcaceae bacterium YRB3002]
MLEEAIKAKEASHKLAALDGETKNKALEAISKALVKNKQDIFAANEADLKGDWPDTIRKRLKFGDDKLKDSTEGIKALVGLPEPIGNVTLHNTLDDGLELYRVTCPIGVIGVIFESRPDALVQIATLCVKSGNAVFLKGGSEAMNTNKALAEVIYATGVKAGLPEGWLHLMTSRADVNEMLTMNGYIDLIIPRGSNEFVQYIMQHTSIPVLGHADGVCHTYINKDCDPATALKVVIDAKTQYVSVCNCTETILIDRDLSGSLLQQLVVELAKAGVKIYGDDYMTDRFNCEKVDEWHKEYLDYKVSVKLVAGIDEAIDHINKYGSGHTDAIITENKEAAEKFMSLVDSASVMVNCSTRFADGFRYGFGAEVGVSTSKIHARGPVGLEGLVSYKYRLIGHGDIVADYAEGRKSFKHIKNTI